MVDSIHVHAPAMTRIAYVTLSYYPAVKGVENA